VDNDDIELGIMSFIFPCSSSTWDILADIATAVWLTS